MSTLPSISPVLPAPGSRAPDIAFKWVAAMAAAMIIVLIVLVGWQLYAGSRMSLGKFGLGFLWSSEWDPVQEKYGALPFIFGTLVSSFLGLLIAVPLGVATALFLTELAPLKVRQPIIMAIEMLAAVPSVIFGLWGIFILIPWLRDHLFVWLKHYLGFIPLFQGPIYGLSMLAAGIIISIMILPIITSISREILRSVPNLQREAAYALGATRWEVLRIAVLSYARRGVIGNRPVISASLFAPGYTLASVIANEFTEATTDLYLSALFELGLVLLVVAILVNAAAQIMLNSMTGSGPIKVN